MNFSKIRQALQIVIEVSFFEVFPIRKCLVIGSTIDFSQLIPHIGYMEVSHNEFQQNPLGPSIKLAKVFSNSKNSKNRCIDLPSKLFSPTSILQVHADDTIAGNYWTFLCLSVPFPCVLRHFSSLITELKSIPQCVPFNMCNFRQSNVGWSF